jgi:membrane-associated phospholipid phosphatase
MWDGFSVIGGGAFPSLHVGISTVALLYAYKYRHFSKLYYWMWVLYIPLVTSLWISTVYLRHHWVIDIFAGWIVAAIGYILAKHTIKLWENLQHRASILKMR